jgi:hypothetical protein
MRTSRSTKKNRSPSEKRIARVIRDSSEQIQVGKLVTIARWCLTLGETDPMVRHRIRSGLWIENEHYIRKEKRIKLIYQACTDWFDENIDR